MKKSLIALAVLAAAGSAFAQSTVTLSGKYAFSYDSGTARNALVNGNAAVSSSGLGTPDGNVTFAAVEDLGGGLKAGAKMDVQVRGRGTAVAGRDATVYLSGNFGTILAGALEAANGIQGLGGVGGQEQGLDGSAYGASRPAIDAASNVDIVKYTSPVIAGGLTVSASVLDTAMGQYGMESGAATQDATVLGVNYKAGPVAFAADHTRYGFNTVTSAAAPDTRTRISGSYNLGVASLGLGYQTKGLKALAAGVAGAATTNNTQTIMSVLVPMGNVAFGAAFTTNKQDGANDIKGYELDVNYSLSKRTTVLLAVQNVSEASTDNGGGNVRVRLMHAF